jgi:hypothetical protein
MSIWVRLGGAARWACGAPERPALDEALGEGLPFATSRELVCALPNRGAQWLPARAKLIAQRAPVVPRSRMAARPVSEATAG